MKKITYINNLQLLPMGSALLKLTLSFYLLFALSTATQAQTTVTLPDCVDCPTGGGGAGGDATSCLTCALDIMMSNDGALAAIACDSTLWVTNINSRRYKGNEIIFDIGIGRNNNGSLAPSPTEFLFSIPTRISGPNLDAVKFTEILAVDHGANSGYVAARTASGETWAYTLYRDSFLTYSGNLNHIALTSYIGPATNNTWGWYRLISGTGANITDISFTSGSAVYPLRFFLDEDGLVWVGGTGCSSFITTRFDEKWAGLGGAFCDGTATSSWSQLSVPEPVVAIASSTGNTTSLSFMTLMVGVSGTLYWFGNTDLGYPGTPTVMPMPGGVAAIDVYETQYGIYIKGADGKLYFTGYEFPTAAFSLVGGGATIDNAGTVIEVTAWTATGKDVGDVFTSQVGIGGSARKPIYVVSTDNVFYYATSFIGNYNPGGSGIISNRGDQFYQYDLEAGANLDYSSGLLDVAFDNDNIFILTTNTLTHAGPYKSDTFVGGGYTTVPIPSAAFGVHNVFPNMYFVRYCNGEYPLTSQTRTNYEYGTISVPPN